MRKFIVIKEKSLFIPIRLHSITIISVIPYILGMHSTSSSLKKKKEENFRKKKGNRDENEWKRGEEEKGMERVSAKGKKKNEERKEERMKEKEKEKKGEEEKEEQTPIKGRLGKNTTPTSRGPTKLNQNLQADPR